MSDTKTTQAMPEKSQLGTKAGVAGKDDSTGGESAGGAYPNPHTGTEQSNKTKKDWHGGQSETAYHGSGQLGEKKTKDGGNANSGSRS